MALKFELAALAAIMVSSAAFMFVADPMQDAPALERSDNFSQLDFDSFDRDFIANGEPCTVGIEKRKMCFTSSPLEATLVRGAPLADHVPMLAAEFAILLEISATTPEQKLLRYGTTLALIDEETGHVEDLLDLGETSFEAAQAAYPAILANADTATPDAY